jgi:hypothetical protein
VKPPVPSGTHGFPHLFPNMAQRPSFMSFFVVDVYSAYLGCLDSIAATISRNRALHVPEGRIVHGRFRPKPPRPCTMTAQQTHTHYQALSKHSCGIFEINASMALSSESQSVTALQWTEYCPTKAHLQIPRLVTNYRTVLLADNSNYRLAWGTLPSGSDSAGLETPHSVGLGTRPIPMGWERVY